VRAGARADFRSGVDQTWRGSGAQGSRRWPDGGAVRWLRGAVLAPRIDFILTFTSDGLAASTDPAPTLFDAVQQQLGLKLERKKGSVDFLVVDHIEKLPTAN